MKLISRLVFLLVFFTSMVPFSFAQLPNADLKGNIGKAEQDTVPPGIMPLDTAAPVSYVLIGNDKKLYVERDTVVWKTFNGDPLPFGNAYLGNLGSAYRPLELVAQQPIGFSTGWVQYEHYYPHEETFKYFNQVIPVAKIRYDQAGKEDTYIDLVFGKRFARGTSLSLAYNRINQVGEFDHQHQKDTGLGIGIWHNSQNGKYDAFYNLVSSAQLAEENGGIVEPDSLGKKFNPDESLEVFITTGLTTHKHRIFTTKQIFHLSADTAAVGVDFWFKAKFETGLFKYVDEDASLDSSYYDPIFQVDDRGIRQYTFTQTNEESAGISFPWEAARSRIEASLRYRGTRVEQEPMISNINEFFLDASGEFHWVEPLTLGGVVSLGVGQGKGIFSVRAFGDLQIGPLGHLAGHWYAQSRHPYLVESTLYVTQQLVYDFDYKNPFSSEIGVSWINEKQDLDAGIKWLVYDNYIYFDTVPVPQQLSGSFSQKQFYVSKGFDFKFIGCKGSWIWQPDTKAELALPENMFSASLYARAWLFNRRLMIMPGFDLIYYSQYAGSSYFPVNGVYHLTGRDPIPDYFRLDAGFGLNINFIKAYFRMQDIVGLFEDRALYQADYYPHYRGYFRFGLAVEFFN
ncbi:MAG TPA: putative porin [Saprospiraceae bacterium]|nr:putative porin [Saprospiraceae bacterium]